MNQTKHAVDWQRMTPGVAILVLVTVIVVCIPDTWRQGAGVQTISNMFLQMSSLGVIAMGALMVTLTGGIDFTAGWGTALAGVVGGYAYLLTENLFVMVMASVLTGFLLGLCNGLVITRLSINPFVTTLAMMSACQGLSQMVLEGKYVMLDTRASRLIGGGTLNELFGITYSAGNPLTWLTQIISVPLLILALVAVVGFVLLNKTRAGIHIYAVGGKEEAAKYAGISIKNTKLLVYCFAGVCYGVASVIIMCRIAQITPTVSGTLLLDAIAATVIGGTSVAGGKGTVGGTVLGTIVIQLLASALIFFGMPDTLPQAVMGLAILVVLLLDSFFAKKQRSSHRIS